MLDVTFLHRPQGPPSSGRTWQYPLPPQKNYGPYGKVPPLLAVEVASPSDSRLYLADKAQLYLGAGVQIVWVVWPDTQTVDVWTPPALQVTRHLQDTLNEGSLFPGLAIPIADIFP